MSKKSVVIKGIRPDDALRVGDFSLIPVISEPPVITSHPIRNFAQTTWKTIARNRKTGELFSKLRPVEPVIDTFTVRKGTGVEWQLFCVDPSNIININDSSNLKFVWKRDGFPLYSFNRLNNGYGTPLIQYSEEQCTEEITGTYVCEVSNDYGTATSTPLVLNVVDLDSLDLMYTNILRNGDGEGGNSNWDSADGNLITSLGRTTNTYNTNTLTLSHGAYQFSTGSNYRPPLPFRFKTKIDKYQLFYGGYDLWSKTAKVDLSDYSIATSTIESSLPNWLRWGNTAQRASVMPNEDYNQPNTYSQGFFPGCKYIDRYNQNNQVRNGIGLSDELNTENLKPLNYFTRNNIRFEEDSVSEFSQIINIEDIQAIVDGNVGGVDYLTAQFFSYVGIAISRYTIRVIQAGEPVDYNWLVHDLNTFRKYLSGESVERIIPDTGTDIEIIPHTDDITTVTLECLGERGDVLQSKQFNGPDALDIWSIKEKVDWPLSLYSIFAFFEDRNNKIKIFGQTYTTTRALSPLFKAERNGQGNLELGNLNAVSNEVFDQNARFILKRYGQLYNLWNGPFPQATWENNDGGPYGFMLAEKASRQQKAYVERGAEAFFAVGGNIDLPVSTRQLRVRVEFTNNSPARTDSNPKSKGWSESTIYNNVFDVVGTADTTPDPYYEYGTPRCAITKMKLILTPNRDIASNKHITYAIPPKNFTVAGIARDLALKDVHNSTILNKFTYTLIQPEGYPPTPVPTLLYEDQLLVQQARENSTIAIENGLNISDSRRNETEVSKETSDKERRFLGGSIDVEEEDRLISGSNNAG